MLKNKFIPGSFTVIICFLFIILLTLCISFIQLLTNKTPINISPVKITINTTDQNFLNKIHVIQIAPRDNISGINYKEYNIYNLGLKRNFHDNIWTKEESYIDYQDINIQKFNNLKIELMGWNYFWQNEQNKLNFKIFMNNVELKLLQIKNNNLYFKIPKNVTNLQKLKIITNTFIPKVYQINNDTRELGLDIKNISLYNNIWEEKNNYIENIILIIPKKANISKIKIVLSDQENHYDQSQFFKQWKNINNNQKSKLYSYAPDLDNYHIYKLPDNVHLKQSKIFPLKKLINWNGDKNFILTYINKYFLPTFLLLLIIYIFIYFIVIQKIIVKNVKLKYFFSNKKNITKSILIIIALFYLFFLLYFKIIFDVFLLIYLFITAYCIGYLFPIKMRLIDKFFIRLALGLGSLGFLIWLSILFIPAYKNIVYFIISLIFILLQVKNINKIKHEFNLIISSIIKNKFYLIIIIISFSFFYIIAACYPIYHPDALAKHIAIPSKIIFSGIWDYNVLESAYFGDFAILEHMFFVFLMSFKGIKSLTIFNFIVSLFILIILLRISTYFIKSNLLQIIITLIYLSTPMVFFVSTTLHVDILPIFFICASLIFLNYFKRVNFINNLPYISLLLGFSCFAKQTVLPIIISLIIIILIKIIYVIIKKEIKFNRLLIISSVSILLFFLPFLPSCLIVFYKSGNPFFPFMNGIFKSSYYVNQNFQDFYVMVDHKLGFNVSSIISMIFNTGRNTEMAAGGIGYHLLLLFLLPLIYFFKRSKLISIYSFIIIFSYFISIRTSYNIRYYLIIIILSIVLCSFIIVFFTNFIKHHYLRLIILSVIVSFLFFPNIFYLFKNSLICKAMLIPNKALVLNPNESILKNINFKDTKLLSNNDTNRGTFKGKYYILNWYNTYYLNRINKNNITPEQFIKSFDYYLIDIRFPETAYFPPGTFSPENPKIKNYLTLIKENATHKLFKVINNDNFESIIDHDQRIYNQKWPHANTTK